MSSGQRFAILAMFSQNFILSNFRISAVYSPSLYTAQGCTILFTVQYYKLHVALCSVQWTVYYTVHVQCWPLAAANFIPGRSKFSPWHHLPELFSWLQCTLYSAHHAVLGPLCTVHYSFHWRCTLYWQCTLYIAVQVQTQDLGKSKFLKHVVTLLFCLKWTHNGISAYGCHKLATVIETRFNLCSCSVVCPLRLLLMLVVWPAQNAGADPSRCNSTNRQNPPLQKNCCNFLPDDAI